MESKGDELLDFLRGLNAWFVFVFVRGAACASMAQWRASLPAAGGHCVDEKQHVPVKEKEKSNERGPGRRGAGAPRGVPPQADCTEALKLDREVALKAVQRGGTREVLEPPRHCPPSGTRSWAGCRASSVIRAC